MQEELNEFERLEVWELIPRLDKVMVITLKWIYKVKLDELGGLLKNKGYLCQPPDGFVDQDNPNHVYKLKKALYGLKQAPLAWYDLLSKLLLPQEFYEGTMDPTLFIRGQGKDILLVQIYVDDIIFVSTTPELFYYALESLKKNMVWESSDQCGYSMVEKSKLDEDTQGKAIDPTHYRGMVGTLMYLIARRPDLTFAIYANVIMRMPRYIDEDVLLGCMQLLGDRLVSWSSKRLMDTTKAQQIALDDALVAPANHALKLTPFYKAFQITANVPEIYMQEFWATICPRLPSQKFEDALLEEEILSFIRDLGHTGEIKVLTDVNVNHMHQP
ncbi:retrovirus-related pol polyprotein from transposon TNT 1-94 [Tanacetum coccineum]